MSKGGQQVHRLHPVRHQHLPGNDSLLLTLQERKHVVFLPRSVVPIGDARLIDVLAIYIVGSGDKVRKAKVAAVLKRTNQFSLLWIGVDGSWGKSHREMQPRQVQPFRHPGIDVQNVGGTSASSVQLDSVRVRSVGLAVVKGDVSVWAWHDHHESRPACRTFLYHV